jgi:electron transfer flavoprotein alpha subunit
MSDINGILVVIEIKNGATSPMAEELFGAAKIVSDALKQPISAVVIGTAADTLAGALSKFGASTVYTSNAAAVSASKMASVVEAAVKLHRPSSIILGETDLGRDIAPILAAKLETAAVTDVVGLRLENATVVATRPVYGGNALADYSIETEPQIIAIRPKAFVPPTVEEGQTVTVVELPTVEPTSAVRVIEHVVVQQQGPKIEEAKIVVGGGRGLGGPEGFAQLKHMADLLGGVVGASRPPCDQGWWPESGQIGVTGKIIAPDLYIAVGISGSSQHVSGVSGSKTIVALNKDAEANIFKVATYGVNADWKKVVPAFVTKLKELTGK